jgi:hypothetical protein
MPPLTATFPSLRQFIPLAGTQNRYIIVTNGLKPRLPRTQYLGVRAEYKLVEGSIRNQGGTLVVTSLGLDRKLSLSTRRSRLSFNTQSLRKTTVQGCWTRVEEHCTCHNDRWVLQL